MLAIRLHSPHTPLRCAPTITSRSRQPVLQVQRCSFTTTTASLQKQDRRQRRPLSRASQHMINVLKEYTGPEDRQLARENEQEASKIWKDISDSKEQQITPDQERNSRAARLEADMLRVQAKERYRAVKKAYFDYRVSLYRRRLITSMAPDVVGPMLDRARDLSRASWGCIRADWASARHTILAPWEDVGMSTRLSRLFSALVSTFGKHGHTLVIMRLMIIGGTPSLWWPKEDYQKRR